jgi:uncharacterized hydrophobic protein (TIGR00271 family)
MKFLQKNINHKVVLKSVSAQGMLTSEFIFYTVIAACIGSLGFLSNSAAVITAAMFISPLMAPVVLLPFSLAVLNTEYLKESVLSSTVGILIIVVISFIISYLSPLKDITPEILARTHPNLFDLLIAFFSGLGASYSYIHQRHEAIAGTAIATALLTPLIVFGFGFAIKNIDIIQGAFFLFLTNFITVIITVFIVCLLYGFKKEKDKVNLMYFIPCVLALLFMSYPLTKSLKKIIYQSYVVSIVKKEIESYFKDELYFLNSFSPSFSKEKIRIKVVIGIKYFHPSAQKIITESIMNKVGDCVEISLFQVALAHTKEKISQNELSPNKSSTKMDLLQSVKEEIVHNKLPSTESNAGIDPSPYIKEKIVPNELSPNKPSPKIDLPQSTLTQ